MILVFWATPGHDCPGLIEASTAAGLLAPWRSATPGHDCPGLIEAAMPTAAPARQTRPLRGMIAPASLKPGARPVAPGVALGPTPGHDCPGLIEATSQSHPDPRPVIPLRGMIAPASLKLVESEWLSHAGGSPLRGMIAPASLKLSGGCDRETGRGSGHSGA